MEDTMTTRHTKPRTSGEIAYLRGLMGINLRVARREALNAAKRADRLMQLGADGAAEAHHRLMTVISELDAIGGAS